MPFSKAYSASEFVDLTADEMSIDSVLPLQTCFFSLPKNYRDSIYTIRLLYPEYLPLTKKEIRRYKQLTGGVEAPLTPTMEYVYARERTENQLYAYFTPIVKQGKRYYYVSSYKPSLQATAKTGGQASLQSNSLISDFSSITSSASDSYKPSSVLSTGKWAKISVSSTGIHRITADVIRKAGFSDMAKVRVYGFGGNLVPEMLTQEWIAEHDDLPEVPTVTIDGEKFFYALGPVSWSSATTTNRTRNPYSDVGCYFITEIEGDAATTTEEALLAQVSSSNDARHYLYEVDDYAWTEMGRNLYDKTPINSGTIKTYTIPVAETSTSATILVNLTAGSGSSVTVSTVDGIDSYTYSFSKMASNYEKVRDFAHSFSYDADALAKCAKDEAGNYLVPVYINCTSGGPVRLDYISAAFDGVKGPVTLSAANYPSVNYVYNITNQNHHADKPVDLVIIIPTSQKWYSQAKRLGELHVKEEKEAFSNADFTYSIVPADELYNEFSSGTPDVSAYRRYLKMFYDRAKSSGDKMPQSVLLFGDCKWDNRLKTLSAYDVDDMLLIYETEDSEFTTSSTGVDDFITILGDGVTIHQSGYSSSALRFDMGVGRLCVNSLSQATQMVDKIETYMSRRYSGKWVTSVMYAADDDGSAGNTHMTAINRNADNLINKELGFDVKKVLLDAYERQSTSTGLRYEGAHNDIIKTLNEGALVFNYGGHASPVQYSDECVFTLADAKALRGNNYSLMYTAACETMPFDQTTDNIGCAAVHNTEGGAIAYLGTLRTVYANLNESLNDAFMDYLIPSDYDGLPVTISEALRQAKNYMVTTGRDRSINKHQYHIFGDPALRLAIPRYKTVVDQINNVGTSDIVEAKANQVVNVKGHVETFGGQKLTDYKGTAYVFVKDAKEAVTTRNNDGKSQITYLDRLNTIYKGTASVNDGEFTINFRVGSYIIDNGDTGLINVYTSSSSGTPSAFGESTDILFTGVEEVKNDEEGPEIDLYLNSPRFVNGGTVGTTPYLHAVLEDKDGLDVMGNTVGHNIELVIDGDATKTYNLNDYFLFDDGSYTQGTVYYVIPALTSGSHTLRLRAWDILGNMSEKDISFSVDAGLQPSISDVVISPNPVKGAANFYIYHDFQGSNAEINIDIIDTTGRLVQTNTWYQTLSVSEGRTSFLWYPNIANGLYLYRVRLTCDGVHYVTKTKKLIVAQ